MHPDLEVDTAALRRCAAELADTGARVAAGAARAPAPPAVPRWETSTAAGALGDALAGRMGALGSAVTAAARLTAGAAAAYDAADDRAAARLGGTR
jgi:hypothetical protein